MEWGKMHILAGAFVLAFLLGPAGTVACALGASVPTDAPAVSQGSVEEAAPGDGAAAANEGHRVTLADGRSATLTEDSVDITDNETPLGLPETDEQCCILHLFIMTAALAVAVYYTHNRKKHQQDQFAIRRELGNY